MNQSNIERMTEEHKNRVYEELFTPTEKAECDTCSNYAKYELNDDKYCDKCVRKVFRDNKNEIALNYIDEYIEEIIDDHFYELLAEYEVKEI